MWSAEHSAGSSASAAAVWGVWADVDAWPGWNPTVSAVSFDGPFADGALGSLKPSKGPRSKVELAEVRPAGGFVVQSRLMGARMRVEHEVVETRDGGSRVTERAVLDGPLARV